jgi:hypothetical protein
LRPAPGGKLLEVPASGKPLAWSGYNRGEFVFIFKQAVVFMDEDNSYSPEKPRGAMIAMDGKHIGSGNKSELSDEDLDLVTGGLKKLPGKRKPPTLTLKLGKNQGLD